LRESDPSEDYRPRMAPRPLPLASRAGVRRARAGACLLALLTLAGCGGGSSGTTPKGRLTGTVTRGPTTPVCRTGTRCTEPAAGANRDEETLEVDLEGGELVVGPVLHLHLHLVGAAASVLDDLVGLTLGDLHDLCLRRLAHGLLARLGE